MPPTISTLQWHPYLAPRNGTTSTPPKLVVALPNHSTLQSHPAMAPLALPQTSPPTIAHYNGNTIAPSNGTQQWHHVHYPKLVVTLLSGTLQWHPAMAPRPLPPCNGSCNGTQQWHPATAPRPLPQSWSSPFSLAPCNGTQQWHHVHYPKVGRHPPLGTLQRHLAMAPAMAPSNGTTSTPPKLVITLPPNHSTLQWHPAMAPRPLPQTSPQP